MINNTDGVGDLVYDVEFYFRCVWVCHSSFIDEAAAVLRIICPAVKVTVGNSNNDN